jgi:crossover junction endodeoxyribonuclease RuvC
MHAARNNRKLWASFLETGQLPSPKANARSPQQWPNINGETIPFCGKILGIDPSLRGTGLAVIDVKNRNEIDLLFSQTVKISPKESLLNCTYKIFSAIRTAIECYQPAICAAEQTIYVQNFQTAQLMGIARGAALAAVASQNLQIFEYAPLRIKQAICGYGRASKEQISKMVQAILQIHRDIGFDETDAIAIAICCYFTERFLGNTTHIESKKY